jgi:hypothetical protein
MSHRNLARTSGSGRRLSQIAMVVTAACTLVLAGLIATACGTTENPGDGGETTTTTLPSGAVAHPSGADQVVFRVTTGGGFVPVEYNITLAPEFTLYGDGTVIVTGPVIAIYPGPALPNLQAAKISEEAVQAILAAAKEAGLLQNGVDYGQPGITDVGTTSLVINAGGQTYQSDIYALGMESGAGGLTMEQQQARAAINDFRNKLTDLTAFESAELTWAPYEYERLAIFSQVADTTTGGTDVEPNTIVWPLGDLATLGEEVNGGFRRALIAGEDLAKLRPLLKDATQITLWTSGDASYHLYFRPLLPDEKS